MTKLDKQTTITSLQQFTEVVEGLLSKAKTPLWYRGINDSDRGLIPRLYEHPMSPNVRETILMESRMLQTFQERCVPYLVRDIRDDWEYLFLMQHFGVPTRLLDWTENPFIGLYFAVAHSKPETQRDAALWVLNPCYWNKTVLGKELGKEEKELEKEEGEILQKGHEFLDAYAPKTALDMLRAYPIAMYGIHNSPRIVSQKGAFTIFGKTKKTMDSLYTALDFPANTLLKIVIPQDGIKALSKSLISIGFSESMLFPDLEGLAREIRRVHGFEVLHV